MQAITVSVGPLATANTTIIADTQVANSATNLTLQSSVVVLDEPRQVQITTDADDSGITFTVFGTTYSNQAISEIITGPNATTANSVLDFATVTNISTSNATAGNVSVGTSNVAHSRWVRFDDFAPSNISIQCNADGTVDYTVQSTLDDPNDPKNPVSPVDVTWVNTSDTAGVNATGSIQSNFLFAPKFARIALNSGNGSVTTTFLQSSNGPI